MKYPSGTIFAVAFQIEGGWHVDHTSKVEARTHEEAIKKVQTDVPRSYGHRVESISGTLGPKKSGGAA